MSRPRPLSSVSGRASSGFDYPPASTLPAASAQSRDDEFDSSATGNFTPPFQHLRRILSRDRAEQRAQHPPSRSAMPPLGRSAVRNRRRFSGSPAPSAPPRRGQEADEHDSDRRTMFPDASRRRPPTGTARVPSERREAQMREFARMSRGTNERLNRSEARMRRQTDEHLRAAEDRLAQLVQVGERLSQEHSSLSELLDTFSPVADTMRRPASPLLGGSPRPSKRRKTSHEGSLPAYVGYRYGHFGQVVPGRLKLEIAHCDGGTFDDDGLSLHKADNVLKNDRSVYCTKSNQCNLLLRHRGEAPFSVQRIVIKAPERGFTAPVQEGLVFVSMSPNELISKSSQYHISWVPPNSDPSLESSAGSSTERSSPDPNEPLTLLEAISDPHIDAAFVRQAVAGSIDPATEYRGSRRRLDRFPSHYAGSSFATTVSNSENCDPPYPLSLPFPHPFGPPLPQQFPVTATTAPAEENEDSSSSEEDTSGAILADRLRRESRWMPSSPDSDDDDDADAQRLSTLFFDSRGHTREGRRSRWLRASRRNAPTWVSVGSDEGHDGLGLGGGEEFLNDDAKDLGKDVEDVKPVARFFIQKDRSRISVRFDPPISGKYILLKLWSPVANGNIDVQNVAAYGFVGTRFFPAMQMT